MLGARAPGPRQNGVRAKIIDVRAVAGHFTGDACRHLDRRWIPVSPVRTSRPPSRDPCPAPPTLRTCSLRSALSSISPSTLAVLAACVASVEGRAGAGAARHRGPLASRGVPRMLEPSRAAAAGKTVHRLTTSRPHSAHGRRERSVGRSADPQRVTEVGIRRLRTNGVPLSP